MSIPSNRKPPKNHKLVQNYVCSVRDTDGVSLDLLAELLKRYSEGLISPLIEYDDGWGDYGAMTFYVTGFVELSAEEKKAAAEERRKERDRKKAHKEAIAAKEKEELRKLLNKYPEVLEDG